MKVQEYLFRKWQAQGLTAMENIGRCCRYNRKGLEPTGTWKRVNTNHKYMGIRFYYEDDVHIWSNARRKSV